LASGDPEEVARYIERKAAKHGVLCYQLCSFLFSDKLPYTHVILPVTTTNDYSASEACIKALEIFDAAKPKGCPSIIVCGDGAFSSAALLRAISRMLYQFCVSVNRNWHADIGEVSTASLEQFEFPTLPLTITRTKLLDMRVSELDSILSHLGFSGLAKLSKAGKSALLWDEQNKSNMKQQTEELKTKAKKARNFSTYDILPNLALYRDHFASVDRLDVFLSNCEAGLKHKYWRARLVERMIMVGLNNIRAVVSEDHRRCFRTAYPRRSADQFLELLVQFILFRADQCSPGKIFFASHSSF